MSSRASLASARTALEVISVASTEETIRCLALRALADLTAATELAERAREADRNRKAAVRGLPRMSAGHPGTSTGPPRNSDGHTGNSKGGVGGGFSSDLQSPLRSPEKILFVDPLTPSQDRHSEVTKITTPRDENLPPPMHDVAHREKAQRDVERLLLEFGQEPETETGKRAGGT